MYYIYVLKGNDKHYVGYTQDIEQRILEHKKGHTKTTKQMGNLELVGYFTKETKTEAIKLEKLIKKDGHVRHWINHETFIKN